MSININTVTIFFYSYPGNFGNFYKFAMQRCSYGYLINRSAWYFKTIALIFSLFLFPNTCINLFKI